MSEKPLKILLLEDDLEEIAVFEEVLTEIEELLYRREWMRACEFVSVDRVADAEEILAREAFDVVLLDTTLPDAHGLEALLRVRCAAPSVPVIVLAATDDESLAVSLVRQGAQDFLIKSELDVAPLSKALRCAIERQRVQNALGSQVLIDQLTGLYSAGGFQNLGELHVGLARRFGCPLRLYLIEIEGIEAMRRESGVQPADMVTILAADTLRDLFCGTDLLARRAGGFAAIALGESRDRQVEVSEGLERTVRRACAGLHDPLPVLVGTAWPSSGSVEMTLESLIAAAESALCENRRSAAYAVP